jgi:hypothetical protein
VNILEENEECNGACKHNKEFDQATEPITYRGLLRFESGCWSQGSPATTSKCIQKPCCRQPSGLFDFRANFFFAKALRMI